MAEPLRIRVLRDIRATHRALFAELAAERFASCPKEEHSHLVIWAQGERRIFVQRGHPPHAWLIPRVSSLACFRPFDPTPPLKIEAPERAELVCASSFVDYSAGPKRLHHIAEYEW